MHDFTFYCQQLKTIAASKNISYAAIAAGCNLTEGNVKRILDSAYSPSLQNFLLIANYLQVEVKLHTQ